MCSLPSARGPMNVPNGGDTRPRGSRVRAELKNRVTVLDGHGLFSDVIGDVLEQHGYRCRVVTAGTSPTAAIVSAVVATRPDMVLASLELRSSHSDGGAVLQALVQSGIRVLAVTDGGGPSREGKALALGAYAVATKTMQLNEFLALTRLTMYGMPVMDRPERVRLVASYREHRAGLAAASRKLESLSAQERVVLTHLMRGHAVQEIAQLRDVSEHTVRAQVRAVLAKLGVSSQVEAVAMAWDNGWDTSSTTPPDEELAVAKRLA